MNCAAHHLKLEGPGRAELQNRALLAAHLARKASGFKAVDPLSASERRNAVRREVAWRLRAWQWLAAHKAEQTRRARQARRAHMRVIAGGLA